MLDSENQSGQSTLNPHNYNPLGVLKQGCFYVSENLSLRNDGSEEIYGTLQEAKRYAWTISRHSLLPMYVLDQSENCITTFQKGIEMLAIQSTLEGIMKSRLGPDVAEKYGKSVWEYIADGYKRIRFENSRLSKSGIREEELKSMKERLDDKVRQLEFVLLEHPAVHLELMYYHVENGKYKNRKVAKPPGLNYGEKHRRHFRKIGHVLTGEYAYQEGWTVGEIQ